MATILWSPSSQHAANVRAASLVFLSWLTSGRDVAQRGAISDQRFNPVPHPVRIVDTCGPVVTTQQSSVMLPQAVSSASRRLNATRASSASTRR